MSRVGPIKVVELFAGVGGFRIGLEGPPNSERPGFKVAWANQWEPKYRAQNAAEIYASRWDLERSEEDPEVYSNGPDDVLVNKDIATIDASDVPDQSRHGGYRHPLRFHWRYLQRSPVY